MPKEHGDAAICARLSSAAYDDININDEPVNNFKVIKIFPDSQEAKTEGDPKVVFFQNVHNDKHLIVAFRGTSDKNSTGINSLLSSPHAHVNRRLFTGDPPPETTDSTLKNEIKGQLEQLNKAGFLKTIFKIISSLFSSGSQQTQMNKVIFTGHSRGATAAEYVAVREMMESKNNNISISCITFDSPGSTYILENNENDYRQFIHDNKVRICNTFSSYVFLPNAINRLHGPLGTVWKFETHSEWWTGKIYYLMGGMVTAYTAYCHYNDPSMIRSIFTPSQALSLLTYLPRVLHGIKKVSETHGIVNFINAFHNNVPRTHVEDWPTNNSFRKETACLLATVVTQVPITFLADGVGFFSNSRKEGKRKQKTNDTQHTPCYRSSL